MSPRKKSRPRALGDLVPQVLGELGYDRANALVQLAESWPAIVGSEAAQHSRPTALRGPVLEASADSSSWCQELQLRRHQILEALSRELGSEAPAELWLRVG